MSKYWNRRYTVFRFADDFRGFLLRVEYKTPEGETCGYEKTVDFDNTLEAIFDVFDISEEGLLYLLKEKKEKV